MGKPKWRKRMGIEPTPRTAAARSNGFEDRESHQAPSASANESSTPARIRPIPSGGSPAVVRKPGDQGARRLYDGPHSC